MKISVKLGVPNWWVFRIPVKYVKLTLKQLSLKILTFRTLVNHILRDNCQRQLRLEFQKAVQIGHHL